MCNRVSSRVKHLVTRIVTPHAWAFMVTTLIFLHNGSHLKVVVVHRSAPANCFWMLYTICCKRLKKQATIVDRAWTIGRKLPCGFKRGGKEDCYCEVRLQPLSILSLSRRPCSAAGDFRSIASETFNIVAGLLLPSSNASTCMQWFLVRLLWA